jgi:hypothetical protein
MAYTTINKSSSYFNTVLFTGNGSNQSITGVGFKPDWVWTKARSNPYGGDWYDVVRGVNNYMYSSSTAAAISGVSPPTLSSFDTDGFTLGANDNANQANGITAVSWNLLAANSTASNTNGSITSTVSANTTSGFSIGKTTGTLSSGTITVGHGLGVAPDMIIWKRTDGVSNWQVYHKSTGTGNMQLNQTSAVNTSSSFWPATSSTTFSVANALYGAGETYTFYCFAGIKGFSKFGSYTGNGSTDGAFVYTGFKPAFLIIKVYSTTEDWYIWDNKRGTYNANAPILYADISNSESTSNIDFLSNGFKCRTTQTLQNGSGATYIYMAFAENPFVTSGGIPVTAR